MSQKRPRRLPKRMSTPQSNPGAGKAPASAAIQVRSRAAFERYLEDQRPVIVDFWAPWCGPCKAMAPIFEQVAAEYAGQVHFLKINTEEVPEMVAAFDIRSIPTLVVLLDGELINSNIGLTSGETLTRMARKALDRSQGLTLGQRFKRLFSREAAAPAGLGQEPPARAEPDRSEA